ncbi:cyanophycinase [Pleurocapsa sp. CCALA 161]|uniref:cyanophycinase n=1 Tax=Pleurocapsa sp. CCALA 161 TaxID=2107688 RepID=UPI000D06A23A|nr:cyanophycinase [Pleurocapsa sp. CCALA 161]PSB11212.1 cyanophycinase [Pleurocapsa sp. CCALA 161]
MVIVESKKSDNDADAVNKSQSGQLIIIGGAEDKEGECQILREFIRRAGGRDAKIVIMTVATSLPGEVGSDYRYLFEKLGADRVKIVDTEQREDASDSGNLEVIENATGVFFTGGDQARITNVLKDTAIDDLLHQKFEQGLVIAGTSAGAAMMADIMIVEGEGETNPRLDTVTLEPGMGFLSQVAIDQHFSQRGRLGRFVSALIQQPAVLGFGIDENTAIAVNGDEIEVLGEGAVTIVDVANISHTNLKESLHDEALAICGAKLHILPNGYRFSLKKRDCLC